jgi:hypothetical protein
MPEQTEAELRFQKWLLDGLPELKRLGYNPTYFLRMVGEHGAAEAVRMLVNSENEAEGFTRLWEMKRLDLSAEAIVAFNDDWADLFTDEDKKKARERLARYGYSTPNLP